MVLTASLCDTPHIMSLSYVNNASAFAVGLRLTMLQIYLYKYWTVAETQKLIRSLTYNLNIFVTMQQIMLQKVQIMSNGGSLYFFTKISY